MNRFALSLALTLVAAVGFGQSSTPKSATELVGRYTFNAVVEPKEPGKRLRLWIPIPSPSPWQDVTNLVVQGSDTHRVTMDKTYGNRMVFVETNGEEPISVSVSFTVSRKPVRVLGPDLRPFLRGFRSSGPSDPERYLDRDAATAAASELGEETHGLVEEDDPAAQKVRALFNHVVSNIEIDQKRESPKVGQGDVAWIVANKKGDSIDFATYLVGLAKSVGVPAFIEFGFPIVQVPMRSVNEEGSIAAFHSWGWFYDDRIGWFPADPADARRWTDAKERTAAAAQFGQLTSERSAVAISRGRNIELSPRQEGNRLPQFVIPYAELDGQPIQLTWTLRYNLDAGGSAAP